VETDFIIYLENYIFILLANLSTLKPIIKAYLPIILRQFSILEDVYLGTIAASGIAGLASFFIEFSSQRTDQNQDRYIKLIKELKEKNMDILTPVDKQSIKEVMSYISDGAERLNNILHFRVVHLFNNTIKLLIASLLGLVINWGGKFISGLLPFTFPPPEPNNLDYSITLIFSITAGTFIVLQILIMIYTCIYMIRVLELRKYIRDFFQYSSNCEIRVRSLYNEILVERALK
jgi:hypothetical protein